MSEDWPTEEQTDAATTSNDIDFVEVGITKKVVAKSIRYRRNRIKELMRKRKLDALTFIKDKTRVLEQSRKEDEFIVTVAGWKAAEKHKVEGFEGLAQLGDKLNDALARKAKHERTS